VRESKEEGVIVLSSIQAKKVVKPLLYRVSFSVPDWLVQTGFKERTPTEACSSTVCFLMDLSLLVLLSKTVKEL